MMLFRYQHGCKSFLGLISLPLMPENVIIDQFINKLSLVLFGIISVSFMAVYIHLPVLMARY
ncbi:hypothetical Protein YC6258_02105 [Gynuella sunshinyii YC6258]|uniref:Uncharacterized protein n=1 Tax=Gynuella sunshinyii YC6258 TaxID=1445510 RepID=A0A0C5VLC8_9GAMM|nr:hypothetical Protein YC6258_02105 [Gynuella sunshinyii YC6258]